MAAAVVSSVRSNLQRLYEVEFTVSTSESEIPISKIYVSQRINQLITDLGNELSCIEGFLKDAETSASTDKRVCQWISDVIEVTFDLDDFVSFSVNSPFRRTEDSDVPEGLNYEDQWKKIVKEITTIGSRLSDLKISYDGFGRRDSKFSSEGASSAITSSKERQLREWRRAYSCVESNVGYVVGFEEDIKELVMQLTTEGDDHIPRVFCILGMAGIGKTTLAKQIYYHSEIRSHFDSFAWVCVSDVDQDNLGKEVLIQLTRAGEAEIDGINEMTDHDSQLNLYQELRRRKCLVILDDVRRPETVDFLISTEDNKNCKILVTSPNKRVVTYIFRSYENVIFHQPRFLDENQSWELLEKKANFGRDAIKDSEDYNEMKKLGQKMLEHCAGLPLAITVLGELLSKKRTPYEWEEMLPKNVKTNISNARRNDHSDLKYSDILWVLSLGYNDLSRDLRLCLLLLAHFPKNYEIRVKEVCRIWMAEGFMTEGFMNTYEDLRDLGDEDRFGLRTMEEDPHGIFNKLKDRSMIQVEKLDSYGRIKTIRIHNLMRDLCVMKAKEQNLLEIINSRMEMDQYSLSPDTSADVKQTYKTRRVSIYVNRDVAEEFFPLINDDGKACLRSLLCFNNLPYPSYEQVIQPILKRFHMLRVLKFENFTHGYVGKLPEEIGELIHLRFLSLKGSHVEQIPSSIGNLIFLQTLDLRTNWKSEFPDVLWKLQQLRHLYFPHRCHISGGKKLRFGSHMMLETLVNFPLSCCDLNAPEIASMLRVKKLKVYFHAELWKDFNLKRYETHEGHILESLALENLSRSRIDVVPFVSRFHDIEKLHLEGKIIKLPEDRPSSLFIIKLTLKETYLQNDPMETLATLPELKILLLNHNAFEGKKMVCSPQGFFRLEYLSLMALEQLEEWKVEEGALPCLRNLLIEDCYKLITIPDGLRSVITLNRLVIKRMPRKFTMKVKESGNDYHKVQHVPFLELVD